MDNDRPVCQYVPRSNLLLGHYHSLRSHISLRGSQEGGEVRGSWGGHDSTGGGEGEVVGWVKKVKT